MKKKLLALPYAVWSVVFIIIPLALIVYLSFIETKNGVNSFTLEHYKNFFTNSAYFSVLWRSIRLAFVSTFICLIIGFPLAYFLTKMKPKTRNLLMLFMILPMWMNFLLRTYAWLSILERNGILNQILTMLNLPLVDILYTETAVVLGMVYNYLPFMVLPIYSVLLKIDSLLIEASEDLGASPLYTFRKIILPLAMPGIFSGITMVFMPSTTTFAISKLLGGGKVVLIGDLIEQQFNVTNNWGFGSAMSVILIIIILITMAFMTKFEREQDEGGMFF